MSDCDVVIVGGGIGGSALGGYLAASGLSVLVLERLTEFTDRVRGEWMAPWGAAELKKIGLYETFMAAGGHHLARSINYDELFTNEQAEAQTMIYAGMHPEVEGPLCLEHVVMQNEAIKWAAEQGADIRRGVGVVKVTAGSAPLVQFSHLGEDHSVNCRLVVGADGRTSTVRRQLGMSLEEAPLDHLIAGLLLDGADGWPEDLSSIGKFGDIQYLVFPQGNGKVRIYADYAYQGKARFNGDDGAAELLAAFSRSSAPHMDAIVNATPIGPCRSYPSQDAWVDLPSTQGAVLIGDAAGYNDPILGQGLSVTLRDARSVGELLVQNQHWGDDLFEPYMTERRERLRRLRFIAGFVTTLSARFGEEDVARRIYAFEQIAKDPGIMNVIGGAFVGPENLPAEFFTEHFYARTFGTTEHLVA